MLSGRRFYLIRGKAQGGKAWLKIWARKYKNQLSWSLIKTKYEELMEIFMQNVIQINSKKSKFTQQQKSDHDFDWRLNNHLSKVAFAREIRIPKYANGNNKTQSEWICGKQKCTITFVFSVLFEYFDIQLSHFICFFRFMIQLVSNICLMFDSFLDSWFLWFLNCSR